MTKHSKDSEQPGYPFSVYSGFTMFEIESSSTDKGLDRTSYVSTGRWGGGGGGGFGTVSDIVTFRRFISI